MYQAMYARIDPVIPQFTELTCSLMSFRPNGNGQKCNRCPELAHLVWKDRAVCLDCVGRAIDDTEELECSVCESKAAHCLKSSVNSNPVAVCPKCIFDTCMYAQAMRNAAQDLGPDAAGRLGNQSQLDAVAKQLD